MKMPQWLTAWFIRRSDRVVTRQVNKVNRTPVLREEWERLSAQQEVLQDLIEGGQYPELHPLFQSMIAVAEARKSSIHAVWVIPF
jgi:primosomal protein N''